MYHSTDIDGVTEINPDLHTLRAIIDSLQDADLEEFDHPDVALVDDNSGWSISLYPNGTATLENLEDEDESPRYRKGLSPEAGLELWMMLADGEIETLLAMRWERNIS